MAELNIRIGAFLTGLDMNIEFLKKYTHGQTPTKFVCTTQDQAVADVAEVLGIGDVSTVDMVVMFAKLNDVDIDTSYDSSFNAELSFTQGEVQIFRPEGIIWIKNGTGTEKATVTYLVIGR